MLASFWISSGVGLAYSVLTRGDEETLKRVEGEQRWAERGRALEVTERIRQSILVDTDG